MGNNWPRFSQSESHLAKKALTLPHAQTNVMKCFQVMGKKFAVPKVLHVPKVSWFSTQIAMDDLPLGFIKASWSPLPFTFMQAREAAFFKTLYPSFDSTRVLPENMGNVIAVETLSNQQDTMQPVIISGFLRSQNFLLHCNPHNFLVRDLQFTHRRALLHQTMAGGDDESNLIMRHYLRRCV
jgi:hypothetical protein